MSTVQQTKVAWIRDPGGQIGEPGVGRLNCRCGNAPISAFKPDSGNVLCDCGKMYTYNGYVLPLEIEPATGWAHHDLVRDWTHQRNVWREVRDDFYHEMLEALPPLDWNGTAFLLSEPYTHTSRGIVYCGLVNIGRLFYARYVYRHLFPVQLELLRAHVAANVWQE